MKLKIKPVIIVTAGFILGALLIQSGIIKTGPDNAASKSAQKVPAATGSEIPSVILVLDDGVKISTFSGIPATSAFAALDSVVKNNGMEMATKQYDFGVFVASLNGKESGGDMSWIYFVNGISGDVAADKKAVQSGDLVEWKYTKAIY